MIWNYQSLGKILAPSGRVRAGNEEYPVLSITMQHGLIDQSEKFKKRVDSRNIQKYKVVYRNELVVGFPIDEGVLGFQTQYPAAIVSPAYDVWKLKADIEGHIPYLEKYLRSPHARALYASKMQGAVARRRSLKKDDFLALKIHFPQFSDQIRIATLLKNVESLIAKRKKSIEDLDKLLKSTFQEMFGDPVKNKMGWDKKPLNEFIVSCRNGLSPSKSGTVKGKVFILSAITGKSFREIYKEAFFNNVLEKYFPKKNDFLVCRGNGNINLVGRGFFFNGESSDILFPDTIISLTIDIEKIEKSYLEQIWQNHLLRSQIESNARTTNGTYKINQSVINKIMLVCPPLKLQNQFAKIVEKVKSIKERYHNSLADLESLYGTFSQKAFKGELDLSRVPLEKEAEAQQETIEPQIQETVKEPQ